MSTSRRHNIHVSCKDGIESCYTRVFSKLCFVSQIVPNLPKHYKVIYEYICKGWIDLFEHLSGLIRTCWQICKNIPHLALNSRENFTIGSNGWWVKSRFDLEDVATHSHPNSYVVWCSQNIEKKQLRGRVHQFPHILPSIVVSSE